MHTLGCLLFILGVFGGAEAFVYTCNEISNTLLPKNLTIPSRYACVVLQDLLLPDTEWLSNVFVRNDASGQQYSLASFSSLPKPCVTGQGPWRVVTDLPDTIDCTYEITLLFSSVETNLVVVQPHTYEYIRGPGTDLTFVSPRGGIELNWHYDGEVTGYERVDFYTGVGASEQEDLYYMASKITNDFVEGHVTDIFDPVVTVKMPSNFTVNLAYTTFADKALNVIGYPGYSFTAMSSGRATTFQEQNTMKVLQAGYGRPASVHVTASINFDSSNDHTLKLQAFCDDGEACGERIVKESTQIDWLLNADKFRINYITGLLPSQIGKNNDTVVITVLSSREKCDGDFRQLGDKCYQTSETSATFADGEADCVSKGGHIASIHSNDANVFLQSLASGAPIGVFIGLSKNNGIRTFQWTDGSDFDYNTGHLDDFGGDCVILSPFSGAWSDSACDFAFKYICEKHGI